MEIAKIGPKINYKQLAIIWSNAADNKMNDFHVEFLNQKKLPWHCRDCFKLHDTGSCLYKHHFKIIKAHHLNLLGGHKKTNKQETSSNFH